MKNKKRSKIIKRGLCGLIALSFMMPAAASEFSFIKAEAAYSEGSFDNLTWTIEEDVLTISGKGDMPVCNEGDYPWSQGNPGAGISYSSVIIEEGVTSVSDYAFCSSGMKSVSLPETLERIGEGAFSDSALESVVIPESTTSIGMFAFEDAAELTSAEIKGNVKTLPMGLFGDTALTEFTIPDSVETIGMCALNNCSLTDITIPENVKIIEYNAFGGNPFESLYIPDTVESMEIGFTFCDNLETLRLPQHIIDGLTEIPENAFNGCKKLTDISFLLTDSLTSIGNFAFRDTSVTELSIPASVEFIGTGAFDSCHSLESVTFEGDIKTIPDSCFENCIELKFCEFHQGLEAISNKAFRATALMEVNLPDSLVTVGEYAFSTDSALEEVILPDSVESIVTSSFNNIKTLRLGAKTLFSDDIRNLISCQRLDYIYVSDSHEAYESDGVLLYNKGRTRVIGCAPGFEFENGVCTLPDTVESVASPLKSYNIKSYAVADTNPFLSMTDGSVTNKQGNTLISYPYGRKDEVLEVPEGITAIGEGALAFTNIERVILPESVTRIESNAFEKSGIKSIDIRGSVEYIGENAFSECEVRYMELNTMSGRAESGALSRYTKVIKLPVGSEFDLSAAALKDDVIVAFGEEEDGEVSAEGSIGNFSWYIRNGVLVITGDGVMEKTPAGAYPWSKLPFYSVRFEGSGIEIPVDAFSNIKSLAFVSLGNTVSIGDNAFYNCTGIISVAGGDGLRYCGKNAFRGTHWSRFGSLRRDSEGSEGICTIGKTMVQCQEKAEIVTIPEDIVYIAEAGFEVCMTSIKSLSIPRDLTLLPRYTLAGNETLEHLKFTGSDTDITLQELQEMAGEPVKIELTGDTTAVARVFYKEAVMMELLDNLEESVYVDGLSREYCINAINELGINSSMSDDEIILAFYDYLMENTYYSHTYMENESGLTTGDGRRWLLSKLFSHYSSGLAVIGTGVCSSYADINVAFVRALEEMGIRNTIKIHLKSGIGHVWNAIGLNVGTEDERWYYHDASNGLCLIGYESEVLKVNNGMFDYNPHIPRNPDGTYTVCLDDGVSINLSGADYQRSPENGTGDVDGNGTVDINDAALVLSAYARMAGGMEHELSEKAFAAGDMDGNGKLDISDAEEILSRYAKSAAGLL